MRRAASNFVHLAALCLVVACVVVFSGCAADPGRDRETGAQLSDNVTRVGHGYLYRVGVRFLDTETGLINVQVYDYESKRTWVRDINLPEEKFGLGYLERVVCFRGKDVKHPIVVVTYRTCFFGSGSQYSSYYLLVAYELDIEKQKIRQVLELDDLGGSYFRYDEELKSSCYSDTISFFDVEVNYGQVIFHLFERTESGKIAQTKKFILKDEGFVPVCLNDK